MDDFRRELRQLERVGYHRTLFAEVLGKLLHAFEQTVIQVLLPLNTVGNRFQQRNLILHALHISTLVNVSVFGGVTAYYCSDDIESKVDQ